MNIFIINSTTSFDLSEIKKNIENDYPNIDMEVLEESRGPVEESLYESSLLLIFFENGQLCDFYKKEIERFKKINTTNATIIPVACGPASFIEGGLSDIKALNLSDKNSIGNLVRRIGAYLGLAVIPKENQIFISYRVKDGKIISKHLSDHLNQVGFKVWRDENRDEDNEGNLTCGVNVQDNIKNAIADSNLVILVDTTEASASKWVNLEIDYANANLVPVIPLCIRDANDKNKGTRFRKLRSLMRYLESDIALSNIELITEEIMEFLANVFKRKREVPLRIQSKFIGRGYSWKNVDIKRLLFESGKQKKLQLRKILSHCPIYEGIHNPIIDHYYESIIEFSARYNDNLLIYDGPLLTVAEVEEILNQNTKAQSSNMVLLHHEQVEEFLDD